MSHIVMNDVRKTYKIGNDTVVALNGLTLSIEAGEFTVVLGPSGSGKTTLLNILGGLESPDSGELRVGQSQISGLSEQLLTRYRRHKVGFVFQFFNLLPTLTALENVTLASELGQEPGEVTALDPREILKRVGLGERLHHYPGQFSGGQQQRVAVARALAKNPDLVLADEPTGSLDMETGIEVLRTMRQLNRETGHTFVVVTHNSAIAQIADRVIRIGNGRVQHIETNASPLDPAILSW